MKLRKLSVIAAASLGFVAVAHANEVLLTANQPVKITFRVAHQNQHSQPVFGELRTIEVNKNVSLPISLDNYDRAGIVIVSANGHELPQTANQFDQPKQCSMTTDKTKATGALEVALSESEHTIRCQTYGGVFG
jgi:hypothetical protein